MGPHRNMIGAMRKHFCPLFALACLLCGTVWSQGIDLPHELRRAQDLENAGHYDEAMAIYSDTETWSSCTAVTGPFPGFPVPLEGDDVSALIEEHRDELPMSDQLPTPDPPKHTDHRSLLLRLITPKRLKSNEEFMWRQIGRAHV